MALETHFLTVPSQWTGTEIIIVHERCHKRSIKGWGEVGETKGLTDTFHIR